MIETPQQFTNLLWGILIGQLIIVIAMAWFILRYILKKKKDEPSEEEIRKVIEKEETQE